MRKFLYLRITAITVLAIVGTGLVYSMRNIVRNYNAIQWWIAPASVLFFAVFAVNSLVILFVYSRYYPNREMSKTMVILFRVSDVIGILCTVFTTLVLMNEVLFSSGDELARRRRLPFQQVIYGMVFILLMLIQIIGGTRMFRLIRTNARKQLEDSFA